MTMSILKRLEARLAQDAAEFKEGDHPRDHGKFTSGGGGGSLPATEQKAKNQKTLQAKQDIRRNAPKGKVLSGPGVIAAANANAGKGAVGALSNETLQRAHSALEKIKDSKDPEMQKLAVKLLQQLNDAGITAQPASGAVGALSEAQKAREAYQNSEAGQRARAITAQVHKTMNAPEVAISGGGAVGALSNVPRHVAVGAEHGRNGWSENDLDDALNKANIFEGDPKYAEALQAFKAESRTPPEKKPARFSKPTEHK